MGSFVSILMFVFYNQIYLFPPNGFSVVQNYTWNLSSPHSSQLPSLLNNKLSTRFNSGKTKCCVFLLMNMIERCFLVYVENCLKCLVFLCVIVDVYKVSKPQNTSGRQCHCIELGWFCRNAEKHCTTLGGCWKNNH